MGKLSNKRQRRSQYLIFRVLLSRKAFDEDLLPHNIIHKDKKFTFKKTEEEKVTLDIENHNIMQYNYLDENFSEYHPSCFV